MTGMSNVHVFVGEDGVAVEAYQGLGYAVLALRTDTGLVELSVPIRDGAMLLRAADAIMFAAFRLREMAERAQGGF